MYTNFAYYMPPHGWFPQYNPLRFAVRNFVNGFYRSPAAREYLQNRMVMAVRCFADERERLHIASGRRPRTWSLRGLAPSINHLKDGDVAYCDDEIAASCGL